MKIGWLHDTTLCDMDVYIINFILLWLIGNYIPRFNEVERGVYWFHLVRLSIRPSYIVCPSVDKNVKFWQIL